MMNRLFILLFAAFSLTAIGQNNILDVRENYDIGQVVTVRGVVTTDTTLGSVRYLQDQTAAIAIYPGQDWSSWSFDPQIGDSIAVTGHITQYNGLLEVGPDLLDLEFLGQTNLPVPLSVMPVDFGEELEGVYAQLEGVVFQEAGSTVLGNSVYEFSIAGQTGVMYTRSTNSLVGTTLPACESSLLGVISQFSFTGTDGYQFLPLSLTIDVDANENGICDDLEFSGCTDVNACNYNSVSSQDDGSCVFDVNGDGVCSSLCLEEAGVEDLDQDGICDDVDACVSYLQLFDFAPLYYEVDSLEIGVVQEYFVQFDPSGIGLFWGADDVPESASEFNFSLCWDGNSILYSDSFEYFGLVNEEGQIVGEATGLTFTMTPLEDGGFGCTDSSACNFDPLVYQDDGSCVFVDECGICGGEGIQDGACDCEGNVIDAIGVCGGDCTSDINSNGVCDGLEIYGCTYPSALNYNPLATADDSSCDLDCTGGIPGCTYELAENYDPSASSDDGTCSFGFLNDPCLVYDGNGDGAVGTADLLGLLTEFGAECTPETAFTCGDPVNHQGHDYETVQIGEQCWFAENVRYLPAVSPPALGSEDDNAAHAYVYGYTGASTVEASQRYEYQIAGALYNQKAVQDWGLCPVGWHVPSSEEVISLSNVYGGLNAAGGALKTVELENPDDFGWQLPNTGATNVSGFSAQPSGARNHLEAFTGWSNFGYWRTTTEENGNGVPWHFCLAYYDSNVTTNCSANNIQGREGYSVRCIKDSE